MKNAFSENKFSRDTLKKINMPKPKCYPYFIDDSWLKRKIKEFLFY